MIDSRRVIKKITPTSLENQERNDSQDLTPDPVIDRPASQELAHSTITMENLNLTSKSHVKATQEQSDITQITNSEDINNTPSALETKDQQDDNYTRGGKHNLRRNPNLNISNIYCQ